jgi:hypothetical protein
MEGDNEWKVLLGLKAMMDRRRLQTPSFSNRLLSLVDTFDQTVAFVP